MTAVYAVTGDADGAGYKKIRGRAEVDPKTGKNRFEACGDGRHAYLVKVKEDAFYKSRIETLLAREP